MRVKGGPKGKIRRKRVTKLTEGFRGRSKSSNKLARQALDRAMAFNYRDRKRLKRDMRSLWIIRITAAARLRGFSYSRLMDALRKSEIGMNRKMLAEIAATEPKAFDQILSASGLK
ncbi:MAG: 50S ribosomal protein L20 [Bradymonadales bacterium]|nr:MAG: 50S ribosomal protein L20 [Bradymonadales bacterium]